MEVTWDKEEGYHRLTVKEFSVLVNELDKLERKNIELICEKMGLTYYNYMKKLLPDIRNKAMDIYLSDYSKGQNYSTNVASRQPMTTPPKDQQPKKQANLDPLLKNSPPLPPNKKETSIADQQPKKQANLDPLLKNSPPLPPNKKETSIAAPRMFNAKLKKSSSTLDLTSNLSRKPFKCSSLDLTSNFSLSIKDLTQPLPQTFSELDMALSNPPPLPRVRNS